MSEEEVIDLLKSLFKKLRKDFEGGITCLSTNEIAQKLNGKANKKNIDRAIKQLKEFKEIESISIDVTTARKIYGKNHKKGLQLFFVVE